MSIPCIRYQSSPIGSSPGAERRPRVYTGQCSSSSIVSGIAPGLAGGAHALLQRQRLAVLDRAEVADPELLHHPDATPVSRARLTLARNCADSAPSSAR